MPVKELLSALDDEQKAAATMETNGVVAAGAGSGKTKVLASRYAWLVMKNNLNPEDILTLTFTNKAVSEMYSRIYNYLLEHSEPRSSELCSAEQNSEEASKARAALENFHKARINTLDSFSANIARTAAARYGISPEFTSDESALRDLAREAALRFVLDHREAPAIRTLLSDNKIRKLADDIFAKVVLQYSPISSPLKFDKNLLAQKNEIIKAWNEKKREIEEVTDNIIEALRNLEDMKKSIGLTKSLGEILLKKPLPPLPEIEPLLEAGDDWGDEYQSPELKLAIKKYFDYYSTIIANKTPGNFGDIYVPLVEYFRRIKGKSGDGLFHELESIANNAFNFGLNAGLFRLIKKFQDEFNTKKRETSLLSFNDIAHLAVDALKDHPDILKVYKDSLRMIMIDEFQDNNALQRDLIYLLADSKKSSMFFVGDEKQSIYRFRGADVSVFRSLGNDLAKNCSIELLHNYRSSPSLIAAFNHIFEKVFLPTGPEIRDYEAKYNYIKPPDTEEKEAEIPLIHFCFLNGEELSDDDTEGIKSQDMEAAFIAGKIRDMVINREKIPKRTGNGMELAECNWGDFAVLERSYTHQSSLEKYFREFAVPYNTDRPSGLFNEAPILDIYSYLRLLVYPEDRIAYAALIRSPFTRLSDLSLAVCMLGSIEPFAEENEALIPEDDCGLYRRARERYRYYREASRCLPVTELITKLWFEEGYRYETLWTESVQVYESLFDLIFSLASESESRGKSLAEFIEYLEDVMNREEKPDDMDIPGDGIGGVRIMTIHKSKGLEFPVVFIFDCSHSGNTGPNRDLVSCHEKFGLIFKIPQAEELPIGGNYFRDVFFEEEKAKDNAELRRLLYVAMTRAKYRLFLTFTLPRQTKKEKKEWDMVGEKFNTEIIYRRLGQLNEGAEGKKDTFLKLLQGILPDCPSSLRTLEIIPVGNPGLRSMSRAEKSNDAAKSGRRSQREAALVAAPFYEKAEILPEGKAYPLSIQASKLGSFLVTSRTNGIRKEIPPQNSPSLVMMSDGSWSENPIEDTGKIIGGGEESLLDKLLKKAGMEPAEFGTLVHAVLEGRISGLPPKILSRTIGEKHLQDLIPVAESMADNFLSSELGRRCAVSGHRESEFSVVTSALIEGKSVAITGQIDLLFIEGDEVVVIDFKTDRIERPEDHYPQLAVYCQAAGDIFGKKVSAWLYYLRSGRALDVTEEINNPAASSGVCCFGKEFVSGFNTLLSAPRGGVLNPSHTIKVIH